MSGFSSTSPTQAWAVLSRHARDDIATLRLKELCTDNDRVSALVAAHNGSDTATKRIAKQANHRSRSGIGHGLNHNRLLVADLSRQRMTLETLNHLLRLSTAVDMKGFIRTLSWGQNDRFNPSNRRNYGHENNHSQHQSQSQHHQNSTHHNNNNSRQRRQPHFSFDPEDIQTSSLTKSDTHDHESYFNGKSTSAGGSPSRSTMSTMKKTRFADNTYSDDQTVQSAATSTVAGTVTPHSPSHHHMNMSPSAKDKAHPPLHTSPSMHIALRAPSHCNLQMFDSNGVNVLNGIHNQWNRVQLISDSIRKGQMRGVSGQLLQNILVIGRGTACNTCEFVYNALKFDTDGSAGLRIGIPDRKKASRYGRSMRFLSRMDPVALHSVLSDWNPDQTLVIGIVLDGDNGEGDEIMHLTHVAKKWLSQGNHASEEKMWGKHILFVTASEYIHRTQTLTKPECSFLLPEYARSEAFTSFTVAGILPLAIAFGWSVVQPILNGAHDMDSHFIETNPRHNIPVLLALVDLWNDHFLPSVSKIKPCGGRIISPFTKCFESYPKFVGTIEAQVCSSIPKGRTRNPHNRVAPSGIIIDGGLGGTFDRVSYQGGRSPPSELIICIDPQVPHSERGITDYARLLFAANIDNELTNQDHLMCSFFAHADVMALGSHHVRSRDGRSVTSGYTFGGLGGSASFDTANNTPVNGVDNINEVADGNHPSTLLMCSRCDAFGCGQLIALAEHRAMVTARLWDIENPYAFASNNGSVLRTKQEELMKDKLDETYQRLDLVGHLDDDDDIDNGPGPKLSFAVKTLLGHYATSMHDKKREFSK